MLKHLRVLIHERIMLPIMASNAPVAQLSWGVAVGMFVGLTPTMGVQMYLAAMIWAVSRYILQFPFNLPVAVALVWLWTVDGVRPGPWDWLGVAVTLCGMAIIAFAPRGG